MSIDSYSLMSVPEIRVVGPDNPARPGVTIDKSVSEYPILGIFVDVLVRSEPVVASDGAG